MSDDFGAGMEPPSGPGYETGGGFGQLDKEARMWGMICHLSALAGLTCIPFANLIAPLVVWLIKREGMPFVDDQGKESVNFQITISIAMVACMVLALVGIGALLAPVVGLVGLVFVVIASIKANEGVAYRYPICLRLIK